ncbi:MAG: hypothetical protein FIB03_16870 [Anaerolineae bacterium]|nr:hypothetical protein [Anaerolineae bacterium]
MKNKPVSKTLFWSILVAAAILLSVSTTYAQVDDVTLRFIKVQQEKVHVQMLDGVAGNPWQYRILADWMIAYVFRFITGLWIEVPLSAAFIGFRFVQCLLIFLLAGMYYRKLGLPLYVNLVGLSILAWGMSHSLYNSDLSLNVFFDIAFYLLATILILNKKYVWIPLLMVPAAFNRETSALIPLMLFVFPYFDDTGESKSAKSASIYAIISAVIFVVIFFGLRSYYGEQKFLTADGYYPGVGLLILNLTRWISWEQLLITLGLVPFLAIFAFGSWPRPLKIIFWLVVPIWFGVHFFASLVAESRLFLVPQALVFIPGMLSGLIERSDVELK